MEKKRHFFNLQTIVILVAFLISISASVIEIMTTDELWRSWVQPSLDNDFFQYTLVMCSAIAAETSFILMFIHFGISANDENRARKLLGLAFIAKLVSEALFLGSSYTVNESLSVVQAGQCVILMIYGFGRMKNRIVPIIALGMLSLGSLLEGIIADNPVHAFVKIPWMLVCAVIVVRIVTVKKKEIPQADCEATAPVCENSTWICECGAEMSTNFCGLCGRKRP